jgi:hypothetical protein
MKMDFYDLNHARSYLSQSIIRVSTRPVYVTNVDKDSYRNILIYHNLTKKRSKSAVNLASSEIDLSPVPLGMYNFRYDDKDREAAFLSRYPARGWKVGLTSNNIKISPVRRSGDNIFSRSNTNALLISEDMERCILGDLPDYDLARNFLKGSRYRSVAFSRNFAIRSGYELIYKSNEIPVGEAQKDVPVLYDDFFFLKEQLQEELG